MSGQDQAAETKSVNYPQKGRFDYVQYDEQSAALQAEFKTKFQELETLCNKLQPGRAQALVLTKLEEGYMWVGKAIRDHQVTMGRGNTLQEHRKDS